MIFLGCAEKGIGHLEAKHCPPRVVSWGLWIFRTKAHGWEDKENTGRSCLVQKHSGHHWPSISHQMPREVEAGLHQENWADDVWGSKGNNWEDCKSFIINNCNYLCVFCECLGQIYVFYTRFFGRVGVTGIVRAPWTSRCPNCCHWATRAPWPGPCCWSWCHDKAILRISSMNFPQFFLYSSWPNKSWTSLRSQSQKKWLDSWWHPSARCSPSSSLRCIHRDLHCLRSQRLVPQVLVLAQRRVVLLPQGTIQRRVTQTNAGYTLKKILPAWLP